jgi:hypothetical protein
MFKKYQIANPCCYYFHNVDMETPMVLHCRADAESYVAVNVPRLTIFGFDVSHNRTSQRCERALRVVVLPVHVRICRYFWHHVAL